MTGRTARVLFVWAAFIALFASSAYLFVRHAELFIRVGMAEDQTLYFDRVRQLVVESEGEELLALESILRYYPSGSNSKQVPGSMLDRIVERARRSAVREVLSILRKRTEKDFGEDPQAWIEGPKDRRASKSVLEPARP